ncbi:pentatricopeptide repeat-containing protein 1, mitochondrial [Osmia lignaria lignaria]|uniref:pentatricopeptide repeat-containing protein 1, mitochondrial n=1 Tax=Osmia lignaria lignaria TaxID=1437193 RepID=UPI00402B9D2D
MFSLKISTILKSKSFIGYIDNYCNYIKQEKQCLWMLQNYNHSGCTNIDKNYYLCYKMKQFNTSDINLLHFTNCNRKFCTNPLPKDGDVFGNISHEKYEKVPMDEDEEKEENFSKRTKIPIIERLSYTDYCKLIKSYIDSKNVNAALNVLDLMKENGDKPNVFIYRLLLSAFALQGDVNQCFKLFKKIRDSGLVPSARVYTSLIQACANTTDSNIAVERLDYLRRYFLERKLMLNVVHYCALIKAYGRHNKVLTAFQIADEARDNGIISNSIATYLFHATIGDKESGLKYALGLWHKMKKDKMKFNILHYNLLLRAIRDTKFGDLKVNDTLVLESPETQIQFKNVERSDLLDSPPVLSTSLLKMLTESKHIVANADTSEIDVVNNNKLLLQNLDDALHSKRLVLFGGVEKFINGMKSRGVYPDTKTITLLLDLLPPTITAEDYFLKYLKNNNINVDITFFNMLIKRRCLRRNYMDAKAILNTIQSYHFTANIITFGVLAIGCRKLEDGKELLEQMDNIGFAPNYTILETLLHNACANKRFSYVLYLMKHILATEIKPSKNMLQFLKNFDEMILKEIENKHNYTNKRIYFTEADYNQFKIYYENWKEKLGINTDY